MSVLSGFDVGFDDAWFVRKRGRLLTSRLTNTAREIRRLRTTRALRLGSGAHPSQHWKHTQGALGRLASRHNSAARAHMQFYRACLESTSLVPSDELVQEVVEIEWLWYSSPFKSFYRDHLAHVMKVALTALELLLSKVGDRQFIDVVADGLAEGRLGCQAIRECARRLGNPDEELSKPAFWRPVVLESTRIAALLHDLAYPAMMASKVRRAVTATSAWRPWPMTEESPPADLVRLSEEHLVGVPFSGYSLGANPLDARRERQGALPSPQQVCADVLARSHSLPAGLRILQFAAQADSYARLHPAEALTFEWAALAAALHDYDKLHAERTKPTPLGRWVDVPSNGAAIRPHFRRDPVSYVLALADQLQDFGRLNYERRDDDPDSAEFTIRVPVERVRLQVEGSDATVHYTLSTRSLETANDGAQRSAEAEKIAELEERKTRDFASIFGAEGWLNHDGLFDKTSVTFEPWRT